MLSDSKLAEYPIANIEKIKKAVRNYTFDEGKSSYSGCSLTFVSNSGYALTARHCLRDIIPQTAITVKEISEKISYQDLDLNQILNKEFPIVIHESTPYKLNDISDYMAKEDKNKKVLPVKIVSILPGELIKADVDMEERFEITNKLNIDNFSDVVVLKFNQGNVDCVQDANHTPNEKIAMIGFPAERPRPFFEQVNETNPPAVSIGEVCEMNSQSFDKVLGHFTMMEKIMHSYYFTQYKKSFIEISKKYTPDLIFHSALMSGGASGSGLFNQSGRIVGVNVSALAFPTKPNTKNPLGIWLPQETYTPGSYITVPIKRIKQMLESQNVDSSEVFDCT